MHEFTGGLITLAMNWVTEVEMIGRRAFLGVVGGGVILAAGAGGWALTRDPADARSAWRNAGARSRDPRERWLSWAILAPNPHNRQPWVADLRVPGEITLLAQLDRRLPHTDPFDRQIVIGLGAFLELMRMAAAEEGVALSIKSFPLGDDPAQLDMRPIARISIAGSSAKPDSLFAFARARRTNRESYDIARPVPASALAAIQQAARPLQAVAASDPGKVAQLRDIAWRAMETELRTPATARESIELTRIGKAEIEANPDGISLAGPFLEGLSVAGLLSRDAMADPSSSGFQSMLSAQKPQFDTAMAFFWIATERNDRQAQLEAGRSYLRANLAATRLGVAMQPFSQALQEYPEMAPNFAELEAALAPPRGARVQMFARLGYAAPPPGSPRWPLSSRIVKA